MGAKVLTIGRQYGSNGRRIGKAVAEHLGIHFYDKDLIKIASERSDIPYEELLKVDEKRANPWRYPSDEAAQMEPRFRFDPMNNVLFETEADIIEELAEKENCVIVGRCANHILAARENCVSVFIHGPLEARIQTIMDRASLDPKQAQSLIKRIDKQRRYYYNYFTDKKWEDMGQYDFCIDSSRYTIEQAAAILAAIYLNS